VGWFGKWYYITVYVTPENYTCQHPPPTENGCYMLLVNYCVSCVVCEKSFLFVVARKLLFQTFFCDCVIG
jgi:hypothetical protein